MDLFTDITPGTTLLTPNRRLAASFLKKHHQYQIKQGKSCWPSLDILPFSSWQQRLWHQLAIQTIDALPTLLIPQHEQLIWEDILQHSPQNEFLLQINLTAELAKSAWGILKQWCVQINAPALVTTEDGYIFQQWATQFQLRCDTHHWIDSYSLADYLGQAIETLTIIPPKKLLLIGFTEISPQSQQLFDRCKKMGTEISEYQPEKIKNSAYRISLEDEETEIVSMARWAKAIHEEYPSSTIACVIPNLEILRDRVLQIFSNVFLNDVTESNSATALPFNISAGKSLAHYPIIHTALELLRLANDSISLSSLSHILRSPFVGEAESEMVARAEFENQLHQANKTTLSLNDILMAGSLNKNTHNVSLSSNCPLLAKRLKHFIENLNAKKKTATISEWVTFFMEQLSVLGWPGERSISSHEYQVVQCWLDILKEFATAEAILKPLSYHQALSHLTRIVTKTIFQPQSPETTIQVLGILEAAQLPFDYLWVMGLDDTVWPPTPKPNPFIPQHLQKKMQMPHATAERELLYCKQLTQQLQQSANEIIFSHAKQNKDTELRTSPILQELPETHISALPQSEFTPLTTHIHQSQSLEMIYDEIGPPILDTQSIRGGVKIFELQAACPFKAFAELRLHAHKINSPMLGLRPQDRGILVHKTLEIIWQILKDQTTLLNHDELSLLNIVRNSVEKAILITADASMRNTRYLTLEAQRLEKITMEWLELEKQRSYFKVHAQEEERTMTIGNIPIRLRIDRIDETDDGKKLIIDYKTGKNNALKAWFGDRPDEPQLPIYCISDPENIVGILFGQINIEKIELKGISQLPNHLSSIKNLSDITYTQADNWMEQIDIWQSTLEKLGTEFCNGYAQVDPKDPVETCAYCGLQSLCRINDSCSSH